MPVHTHFTYSESESPEGSLKQVSNPEHFHFPDSESPEESLDEDSDSDSSEAKKNDSSSESPEQEHQQPEECEEIGSAASASSVAVDSASCCSAGAGSEDEDSDSDSSEGKENSSPAAGAKGMSMRGSKTQRSPSKHTDAAAEAEEDATEDAKDAAQISKLEADKAAAVAREDYDTATQIKDRIELLREISKLKADKAAAVAGEEYNTAKQIKDRIKDRIRQFKDRIKDKSKKPLTATDQAVAKQIIANSEEKEKIEVQLLSDDWWKAPKKLTLLLQNKNQFYSAAFPSIVSRSKVWKQTIKLFEEWMIGANSHVEDAGNLKKISRRLADFCEFCTCLPAC